MPGASFVELTKPPEQQKRKLERSLASVTRALKKEPSNPRWHFYHGWNLEGLERWEKAIQSYSARSKLGGWDEEAAWACFRAAHCCTMIGDYAEGVRFSARGLAILPTMAELAWMASYCNYKDRNWRHAIAWARLSVAGGEYQGSRDLASRTGFRFLPGLYEKPFEVMRYTFEETGEAAKARLAQHSYDEAKAMRMKTHAQAD
jgi:tetratricopeptide (TPR) repeat protein